MASTKGLGNRRSRCKLGGCLDGKWLRLAQFSWAGRSLFMLWGQTRVRGRGAQNGEKQSGFSKSCCCATGVPCGGGAGLFSQVQLLHYTQEYVAGTRNIKGDVDVEWFTQRGPEFAIGANGYGYAVFKYPERALRKLEQDYAEGLALIQREYHLGPLSAGNYESYGNYGWQVNMGTEETRAQAMFVSDFMDIYENCYQLS